MTRNPIAFPDSPLQDPAPVVPGEMPHHHGQNQSIVRAEQPFQEHQYSDVPADERKVSDQGTRHAAAISRGTSTELSPKLARRLG